MRRLGAALALLASIATGLSFGLARADGEVGIVLMHGKLGTPMATAVPGMQGSPPATELVSGLRGAGYLVVTPEMCWSRRRGFDAPYADCLREIDTAIGELRSRGATAIVVAGLSLGGNAAIAYGATHSGLLGVVGLSPADNPGPKAARNPNVAASVVQAQQLVAAGKGDESSYFFDANTGAQGGYAMSVHTTARIFLSFNDPHGLASMGDNTPRLTAPLLWVAGDSDPTQVAGTSGPFSRAPANPHNRYVRVHANHVEVPDAATDIVLKWLAELRK